MASRTEKARQKRFKRPDEGDASVLVRCGSLSLTGVPDVGLPYLHMTHERSTIFADGFRRVHHFYSDRALATLSILWTWAGAFDDHRLRQALAVLG